MAISTSRRLFEAEFTAQSGALVFELCDDGKVITVGEDIPRVFKRSQQLK